MTSKNDDGGAAFPIEGWADIPMLPAGFGTGMSLRDWFAGQALVGCCTHAAGWDDYSAMAKASYDLADAMLAERSK